MNYKCKELQQMIDRYESNNNVNELIHSLKQHIAEYGGIYDVAGISKEDLAEYGYDIEKVDDEIIEKIAQKADISDALYSAVYFWAEQYGLSKIEEDDEN